MSDAQRMRVLPVLAEEIADLVLGLIRDDACSGGVMSRAARGGPELLPLEGP
jgi:hypothetical protein